MNIKNFLKDHKEEFSIYLAAVALLAATYVVIVKFMPIIMNCRVVLD